MKILKYPLQQAPGVQVIHFPVGAQFLSAQVQRGRPVIWVVCDEYKPPTEAHYFVLYATGEYLNGSPGEHRATLQLNEGFVLHLFEKPRS